MPFLRILCLVGLAVMAARGQEFRATLQGTISDPTGAAVPNATVTLTSSDTGQERSDTTDADGHYLFTFVVPGRYSLNIRAVGFKTSLREDVSLSVNDSLRVDLELA